MKRAAFLAEASSTESTWLCSSLELSTDLFFMFDLNHFVCSIQVFER
jgi:hypothetical protein